MLAPAVVPLMFSVPPSATPLEVAIAPVPDRARRYTGNAYAVAVGIDCSRARQSHSARDGRSNRAARLQRASGEDKRVGGALVTQRPAGIRIQRAARNRRRTRVGVGAREGF